MLRLDKRNSYSNCHEVSWCSHLSCPTPLHKPPEKKLCAAPIRNHKCLIVIAVTVAMHLLLRSFLVPPLLQAHHLYDRPLPLLLLRYMLNVQLSRVTLLAAERVTKTHHPFKNPTLTTRVRYTASTGHTRNAHNKCTTPAPFSGVIYELAKKHFLHQRHISLVVDAAAGHECLVQGDEVVQGDEGGLLLHEHRVAPPCISYSSCIFSSLFNANLILAS